MRLQPVLALLIVGFVSIGTQVGARASEEESHLKLHLVRKIYVGRMGETDEADRFRMLLEEELTKRGFTIVDQPEKADGVLTGALSVRVHEEKSRARVYVKLSTPAGERLWGRDFGSRLTSPFNRTEPVKLRAHDVANGLRQEWERSAKVAGVKADQ